MAKTRKQFQTDWAKTPANLRMDKRVVEAIGRRRRQMLVHSCIYYALDENVVDDHTWTKWAQQLAKLQDKYGHRVGFYDSMFEDWDGSSGHHLKFDADVMRVARRTLDDHKHREYLLS